MKLTETIDYAALVTSPLGAHILWCRSLNKDWAFGLNWYLWLWGLVITIWCVRIVLSIIVRAKKKNAVLPARRSKKEREMQNHSTHIIPCKYQKINHVDKNSSVVILPESANRANKIPKFADVWEFEKGRSVK